MYLTDGVSLYRETSRVQNFGLRGGHVLVVEDCSTGSMREMGLLEQAVCRTVTPQP